MNSGSPTSRNFGLDFLRAAAIAMVLLWHVVALISPPSSLKWTKPALDFLGFIGVELFFVLSGFLIGGILLRSFDNLEGFKTIRLFWIRRWLRTLPAYYVCLAIYIILFGSFTAHAIPYGLFMQNLIWPMPGFFGQSWSLAVEEWYYLLFPPCAFVFAYFCNARRSVIYSALILGALSCLARFYMAGFHPEWTWRFELRKVAMLRLDSLVMGMIVASIKAENILLYRKLQSKFIAIGGIALIAAVALLQSWLASTTAGRVAILLIVPLGFALVLPAFENLQMDAGKFGKVVTRMAIWSYSLYLYNNIFFWAANRGFQKYFDRESPLQFMMMAFLAIVSSFVAAAISYKFIEKPSLAFRDKYFQESKTEANKIQNKAA